MTFEFFLASVLSVYVISFCGGFLHGYFLKILNKGSQ